MTENARVENAGLIFFLVFFPNLSRNLESAVSCFSGVQGKVLATVSFETSWV